MSLATELHTQTVDNRDQGTTWLWLNDTEYVEVNPIDLFENMIENCYNEDMSFLFLQFKQFLERAVECSEDIKSQRADYIEWFADHLNHVR